tara:strand:+ start:3002 stop:3841 length:840 start_codon:yes stop_codon:yes gene_type:complete
MTITYEERKQQILKQIADRRSAEKEFLLMGITGKPKVGKSGLAMDCRTEEEIKSGMKVRILDLDDGSTATWDSAWNRDENIEVYVPNVWNNDGSVDWDETFHNCSTWIKMTEEDIKEGNIKAVILDGVDKIYEGSSDVLRKSLVKNAARSGSVIQDSDTVRVSPLDWKVRNKIYDRILNPFIALRANRFLITHMKPVYEGIGAPIAVGETPDWYKTTPHKLLQILNISEQKLGKKTTYKGTLVASKTNSSMVGKSWPVFVLEDTGNVWNGIPELKTGEL